ncbi:related to 26S proteasome regulatory subunit RPN9 [Saccharomycodes ludwigii]|uniref:Related to 26S proteasome regulatory subunit RPN9 n=1 Tax=Saccharomycodes ludwigii TaxID=36035 RepID=A0A376B5L8_9ASCO|nr:hypothetical protein SCDLUD_003313 [Saccharomycodes ludwigii]KAH3900339.1 hypothetical protein SCDLUD_003313 [Saccharomycodes ludwigii]SSD59987.1 related to 26S proteasome regulatory subunit RPN9 [Saccharomycodes ludwigii]
MDAQMLNVLTAIRLQIEDSDISSMFFELADFYEQKLWNQLTTGLKIVFHSETCSSEIKLSLFTQFVWNCVDKLNQLQVVDFLLCSLVGNENYEDNLGYLNNLMEKFKEIDSKKKRNDGFKTHENGELLIRIEICRIYLKQNKIAEARNILDEVSQILDENNDTLPLRIISAYYSVSAYYYQTKSDFNSYYYNILLYLSSSKETKIPVVQEKEIAYNLSIAALLGDKIYNFGELLQHPIMENIDSDKTWLLEFLNALTLGDFDKFELISKQYVPQIEILANNESFLRQKICLMTLVEMVSAKNVRTLNFTEIAEATHLHRDEVEHLVMKSISLGLLKGRIDQVSELVLVTWVQPRVMNEQQILKMHKRLIGWHEQVHKLGKSIEARGKGIWV